MPSAQDVGAGFDKIKAGCFFLVLIGRGSNGEKMTKDAWIDSHQKANDQGSMMNEPKFLHPIRLIFFGGLWEKGNFWHYHSNRQVSTRWAFSNF